MRRILAESRVAFTRKPAPLYRYKLSGTGDRVNAWLDDRKSKCQWESDDLSLDDFVTSDVALTTASMADYVVTRIKRKSNVNARLQQLQQLTMALRGAAPAISVEHATEADGTKQQHVLATSDTARVNNGGRTGGPVNLDSIITAAEQLHPFATKIGVQKPPTEKAKADVTLPEDPEDPTINTQRDYKDRTFLAAQKYDFVDGDPPTKPPAPPPGVLVQSPLLESEVATGVAATRSDQPHLLLTQIPQHQQQEQFPMMFGGFVVFAAAGVLVNELRCHREKQQRRKVDGEDSHASYVLFE